MPAFANLVVVSEEHAADASRMLEEYRREEALANPSDVVGHESRVARTTNTLAMAAGVPKAEVQLMTLAARFHDIGKLDVPAEILGKPGRFTPEERAEVERHAEYGARRLERIPGISPTMVDAARYHHERYDGHGYVGLAGEDIPLVARIVAIADVHDALTAKRVYKDAIPEAEVLLSMSSDAPFPALGADAFDPALLRTFVTLRLADPAFSATDDQRRDLEAFSLSIAPDAPVLGR